VSHLEILLKEDLSVFDIRVVLIESYLALRIENRKNVTKI